MTTSDLKNISGVERVRKNKKKSQQISFLDKEIFRTVENNKAIDLKDKQVIIEMNRMFPGSGDYLRKMRGGENMHIPLRLTCPEDVVYMFSDLKIPIDVIAEKLDYTPRHVERVLKSRI